MAFVHIPLESPFDALQKYESRFSIVAQTSQKNTAIVKETQNSMEIMLSHMWDPQRRMPKRLFSL
jgi:hypothetical protein